MRMVHRPILATALALLLPLAPAAGANPLGITATHVELDADLLGQGSTIAPGDMTEGFLFTRFCYGTGGLNPFQGAFVYEYEVVDLPSWLDVRITSGYSMADTPPFGPTVHDGCYDLDPVSFRAAVSPDAPHDTVGIVTFAVSVSPSGNVGTYATPDGATASTTIRTTSAP